MNNLLITNIQTLIGILPPEVKMLKGAQMRHTENLAHAWLYTQDGLIADFGTGEIPANYANATTQINAQGKLVMPSYIDSHSHIVFAATREEEFVMRINGKTYEEIAEAGGGILNSAAKLQALSEEELFASAYERLFEVIFQGTGALEVKSGYGLTVEDELKMLQVIKRLQQVSPIPIRATFLGAHAIPTAYKNNREGYIQLIIDEMLPAVAKYELASYCDVFCDQGFFTPEETLRILKAAAQHGLKAKIHGNELGYTGGVQSAVKAGALSVDHLEYTGDAEISCLLNSTTMPVALPGCSFFLGIPYAPVRKMIDAGLPVCLASDYNPGSTPNGRMGFVFSLACTQMKLTPEEAFNAMTINGAYALELSHELGSITKGKRANLIVTNKVPSLAYLPYHFGSDAIEQVIINGKPLVRLS